MLQLDSIHSVTVTCMTWGESPIVLLQLSIFVTYTIVFVNFYYDKPNYDNIIDIYHSNSLGGGFIMNAI